MKSTLVLVGVAVLSCFIARGDCITNGEFLELIEPYTEFKYGDIENANDVISLPGELDDELDVDILLSAVGLDEISGEKDEVPEFHSNGLSWWHHKKKHVPKPSLHCHKDGCDVCLTHKFKVLFVHFTLKACGLIRYLPNNGGFVVILTLNGHELYKKEIPIKKNPKVCVKYKSYGTVCLVIYDVNLKDKHMCTKLEVIVLNKYKFHFKLACFTIPLMESDLNMAVLGKSSLDSGDLAHAFRALQGMDDDADSDSTLRFE